MTDDSKLREQAMRADAAERILNDPFFQEAFDSVEEQILKAWKNSGPDDMEDRERWWLMHRLSQNLKQHFVSTIANGKQAHIELVDISKQKEG